ncbi:MAG: VIT domain-containing protein [Thermoanaerobaculia bacterium]
MRRAPLLLALPLLVAAFVLAARPQEKPRGVSPVASAPDAPLRLSDPDGQEMRLEELSARAAVHGMLSLTELELVFRNPHPRRMEGRFTCVLPPGAAISRFAKEVNGRLMEGEVVERLKANRVYDEILHQMRDPALLEQDQGNRFSARVFPIEAGARVRLVLSYSRLLPLRSGRRTFSLPLRGLPTMDRFSFRALLAPLPGEAVAQAPSSAMALPSGARRGAVETVDMEEREFTPKGDVELSWASAPGTPRVRTLVADDFAVTSFLPQVSVPAPSTNGPWLFLVDTSASAAEAGSRRVDALERVLAALPGGAEVRVVAFDQEVVPLGRRSASAWAGRIRPALEERGFLGGTDLAGALATVAGEHLSTGTRVVLVSDGVATLGDTEPARLAMEARKLPEGVALHALVLGSRQDADTLALVTRGRGRVVLLPFGDDPASAARDAAAALSRPLGPDLEADDAGAEWSFPSRFPDVAPGDELLVLSRLRPGAAGSARLRQGDRVLLRANGVAPLPSGSFGPLLAREAWTAYLAHLAERERAETSPGVREALANEQVKVSVERRILVPRTTLLVLETEEDYRRFGLDRRALAEILAVGATGIERVDRAPFPIAAAREEALRLRQPEAQVGAGRKDGRAEARASRDEGANLAFAEAAPALQKVESPVARDLADAMPEPEGSASGGVEGGIEGGVMGGVLGSVRTEARTRTAGSGAAAPASVAAPAPPAPPRPAESPARIASGVRPVSAPAWIRPVTPSADDVARLSREVKANPFAREGWNRLSEALAARKEWIALLDLARRWQEYDPENPQVYECRGEAALALGKMAEARRAFGSLVEVAPGKPELLQRAGLLLVRAGDARLAETPLRQSLKIRPDRANASRHLALVLWRSGKHAEAARVLEEALARDYPGWYRNVRRVLAEELALVWRDWIAREPDRRATIERRARERGIDLSRRDALRVTLAWETDANDVDLHVVDPSGEECFYGHPRNASGLELYEDVTQGLGPEVIRTERAAPGTYSVGVNYFAAGPMGVARGVLVVVRDDGRPGAAPTVEVLPFRLVPDGRDMKLLARIETGGHPVAR